jgi:DNA-binding MarR family transcriptional regulator
LTNADRSHRIGFVAEQSLSRRLLDASRSLAEEVSEALRDRGITDLRPSQAAALLLVDRMGGTRLSDLAQRADVTKQAMMQVVDDLASIGCVRRTPDLNDARAKVVKLTAKGLRHRAAARKAIQSVEARARRRLGERRYDALNAALVDLGSEEE